MSLARLIKRILPRSLLGRSLLMILLPLLLLQAVTLQFFYGSHLDVVSRRLTGGVAADLAYTLELLNRFP
jgi:two-component system, OmpR family, osmolarity sensor histidine kinase EnvZ